MSSKSSVLFIAETGDSSCAYYRAHIPAKALNKLGWRTHVTSVMFSDDAGYMWGVDMTTGKPIPLTEYVVCRRMNGPDGELWNSADAFRKAQAKGQKVLMDLDDDPWNIPTWNPAYGTMSDDALKAWQIDMEAADGVTVSTTALGWSVNEHVDAATFVARNGVDPDAYKAVPDLRETRKREKGPLRLGWLGTTDYRGPDLTMIVKPLREALEGRFGEVEFWHLGAKPGLLSVHDLLGPNFPVQVREVPWTPITSLPYTLSSIDVAVVPQVRNKFSDARSNVTGLALMTAGVGFAATATDEYLSLWSRGGGFMVNDANGWAGAIRVLVDPVYAQAVEDCAVTGRHLAAHVFDTRFVGREWEAVLHAAGS